MPYTGYIVSVYQDCNPYSATYGQERTERTQDTESCPVQKPANYVQVYTYCEMNPNGSYTGNCVIVYEDVEPLSATYGNQMEEVYSDGVLCPPDSADADWQQIDQYCEQIAYQPSGKLGNSGYMVTVQQDMGEYSPTYGQTRENKVQDLVHCTPPSTEDVWVIISETCHLENGVQDGTKDVVRVNTNEYSPNYNDGATETINVEDTVMCPPDPTAPVWTETSYVCEQVDGYNTGYTIITEEDTNPQSSTYGQTRTRRVSDDSRCPLQTADTFTWRIINNRSASTDTITSITVSFNNGAFDIVAGGSLAPVGGQINGSSVMPANLKSTGLVCSSITLTPNNGMPTIYQFSQTPSPYTWNTDYASTLIITIWDGDGTGPEWTEISYVCETVDGYRTGASTVTEQDMNPDSATYGQTRTRVIEYDSRCPAQTDGDWVETSWSCQQENGYNTGYRISVQTDQNPNSPTYGTTRSRLIYDTTNCPLDTTAAWTEVSYECETVDGHRTGNAIVTEEDINPGSATYGQTRTRTVSDDERCAVDTDPNWVVVSYECEDTAALWNWEEISRSCELDGNYENTGNAIVVERNINPNSAEYGQTRTTLVEDLTDCPIGGTGYKLTYIYNDRETRHIVCNGDPVLSKTEISSSVGAQTSLLSQPIIGNCVETVGVDAFRNYTGFSSVEFPVSVTQISGGAFSGCSILRDVELPPYLTVIGSYAFDGCRNIVGTETIPTSSTYKALRIPDTVTDIDEYAFAYCTSIQAVHVGTGITYIGYRAFYGDSALVHFIIDATTPPTLGANAFNGANAYLKIYVPSASVSTYKAASGWSTYSSRIQAIPNS